MQEKVNCKRGAQPSGGFFIFTLNKRKTGKGKKVGQDPH